MMYTLRFDVETLIIATGKPSCSWFLSLRFDVETLIIATCSAPSAADTRLRFDVETLIIATEEMKGETEPGCGLMEKL